MADLFGREPIQQLAPITADKCSITFDEKPLAEAMQISIQYNQSVTRRRSIGGKVAVIYGSQPSGQATIGRMMTTDAKQIFDSDSWKGCKGGKIQFKTAGCGDAVGPVYSATGCMVTSYSIQAQAEDLTVIDNITIDFLELSLS